MKNVTAIIKTSLMAGLLTAPMLLSPSAFAAPGDMKFHGTLLEPPPCVLNGGTPIDVDFGSTVMTTRVDGANYIQTVNYNMVCNNPILNTLRLKIQGTGASFDGEKLLTDKADLAIALSANGQALPINTWLNFTNPARPVIKAVPVKKAGTKLAGGAFNATATMMVDYQ